MASTDNTPGPIVRVGLIGCGEVAQTVQIPTLGFLQSRFAVTYLCDVSQNSMDYCARRVFGAQPPKKTSDAAILCASTEVDVVFILSSNEYHADQAVLALQHGKHVLIEKPAALNLEDLQRIRAAERESSGKVMVGYMRQYAPAFADAVKEIGGLDKILYARVRDIIGPNNAFVSQSGLFPARFTDFSPEASNDLKARGEIILNKAFEEIDTERTPENSWLWRMLGSLGSHDLSAMREALGMPTGVHGAALVQPFWNALFQFPAFTLSYESGMNSVPRFDAHIEVYGAEKTVRVQFDTPYIKGLPVTIHIDEKLGGSLKSTTVRTTYEDAYTVELKELYEWVVNGKEVKTTIDDAENDLKIFQMIMKALK